MAKSFPINLKALWVIIEKNKSYFHLYCIDFIFFNVNQCHAQKREKPLIAEKYSMPEPSEFSTYIDLI